MKPIIIPNNPSEVDKEKFKCPHCGIKFIHEVGDLGLKKCQHCSGNYSADDLGGIAKYGEIREMVYDGENFILGEKIIL